MFLVKEVAFFGGAILAIWLYVRFTKLAALMRERAPEIHARLDLEQMGGKEWQRPLFALAGYLLRRDYGGLRDGQLVDLCNGTRGALIMYSVMISLAATSIWLGRNQTLYDFWFYITNFSRYPLEIYARGGAIGMTLFGLFTFVVPVLVVINVPARLLAQPLRPNGADWEWPLAGFAVLATLGSLAISRWIFQRALGSYRSASS